MRSSMLLSIEDDVLGFTRICYLSEEIETPSTLETLFFYTLSNGSEKKNTLLGRTGGRSSRARFRHFTIG